MRTQAIFHVREDGQVDAQLVGDFPIFNDALSDSVSSLPPRNASGNGPSSYWVDIASNAIERHLVGQTEGIIASGNATSIHLEAGRISARDDYGSDEVDFVPISDFVGILKDWRDLILEQSNGATHPFPETYRRNRAAPIKAPSRAEVERRWRNLVSGESGREETARWARAWERTPAQLESEPFVMTALQSLDGFDLTHDPANRNLVRHGGRDEGRPYVHSEQHVAEALLQWLAETDPADE